MADTWSRVVTNPQWRHTCSDPKAVWDLVLHTGNAGSFHEDVLSNGFDVWELVGLLYVVDALAVRRSGLTALFEGRVVEFPTRTEAIEGNPQAWLPWRAWARRSIGVQALTA